MGGCNGVVLSAVTLLFVVAWSRARLRVGGYLPVG